MTSYPNTMKTVEKFHESSFKEKGSTFTGQVYHVITEEEAEEKLREIRKKYYDATHHCYAWRLIGGTEKYSDDGEPNGTAGIRLLNAIEHFGVVNVLVVSIRYYGGTKLGVGPLGKAYYQSGYDVLEGAAIRQKQAFKKVTLHIDVSLSSSFFHLLGTVDARILGNDYRDGFFIEAHIPADRVEQVKSESVTLSRGQAVVEEEELPVYL